MSFNTHQSTQQIGYTLNDADDSIQSCLRTVVCAVIIALLLHCFLGVCYISGPSMEPNYYDNDIVVFSRLASYDCGDVVIVYSDYLDEYIIKRVIGVEGDTIEVTNGVVYRNGVALNEDYAVDNYGYNMDVVTVPDGAVFVMGDNRPVSLDSRNANIGAISVDDVTGEAVLRVPLGEWLR